MWKGQGRKTVSVQQMQERCESIGVTVDWKRIDKIVQYRNEIEHYYTSLTQTALRSLVADSFILIRDFMRLQLKEDPLNALGAQTWTTLTSVSDVYEKEKQECEKNIGSIDWKYEQVQEALNDWQCEKCGSGLIDVLKPGADKWVARFQCRACGNQYDYETAAEKAIQSFFAYRNYRSIKDGGEEATIVCPECGHETYDLEEDCCLICEESTERECQLCGTGIPACEIDGSGFCGWCNHLMSKDD